MLFNLIVSLRDKWSLLRKALASDITSRYAVDTLGQSLLVFAFVSGLKLLLTPQSDDPTIVGWSSINGSFRP
jgi:hypothetical protein